jgi:hypothetical protein
MLSIIHKQAKNGNTYAEISSVSSVPKGMNVPEQFNESKELNYDKFDWELFETLPDFIKDKMKQTDEFKFMMQPHETSMKASIEMDNDLDLPF